MRAVFLYGPPAVGKLTVGRELAHQTGLRLVHNHLVVDLVTSLFPFQSDPWIRLLRQVKQDVFSAAAAEGVDIIITGVYAGTPAALNEWRETLYEPIGARGGLVLSVHLTCEPNELFRRVQAESRQAYGKLRDPQVLANRMQQGDIFAPLPFQPQLRVDSTNLAPDAVASRIATHFELPLVPDADRR